MRKVSDFIITYYFVKFHSISDIRLIELNTAYYQLLFYIHSFYLTSLSTIVIIESD